MQYFWGQELNFPNCFRIKLKEREQNTKEHPRSIDQNVTSNLSEECAANMPKFTSVGRAIQQERLWSFTKDRGGYRNSYGTSKNCKVEKFLAHDSGPADSDRLLVFAPEANLDILERCKTWHAEGTW